jgi:hypothetical protein
MDGPGDHGRAVPTSPADQALAERFLAARPRALLRNRELIALQRAGQAEPGDAATPRIVTHSLQQRGGLPPEQA